MMDSYIFSLLAGATYLIVGLRLARLALRTRQAPERLLSGAFLFTGISYVLYEIAVPLDREAWFEPLTFAGRVAFVPAIILVALFTRRVFRPHGRGSAWAVYGTTIAVLAGLAGSALIGDWEGISIRSPWFWIENLGYAFPYGWAGAEALAHYPQARRRLKLGLCAPRVCNRLLCWGVFGVFQVAACIALVVGNIDYSQREVYSASWDALIGGLEMLSVAIVSFIFLPPVFGRKRFAEF